MRTESRAVQPEKTKQTDRRVLQPFLSALPCVQVLTGNNAGRVYPITQTVIIGRDPKGDLPLDDPGVSWTHARLVLMGPRVYLEDLGSTNGTYVGEQPVTNLALTGGEAIHIGPTSVLKFGYQSETEIELAGRLFQSATRDHLTGALNRGSFFERLEQEVALQRRQNGVFSIIMVDVDHFKSINDTYGHPAGDAALRQLADQLRASSRMEDVVGRYGGEEFCILLRNIGPTGARDMAERVRREVAAQTFHLPVGDENKVHKMTVSIGVSEWRPPEEQADLLARADEALYAAKEGGRDRVVCAS